MLVTKVVGVAFTGELRSEGVAAFHSQFLVGCKVINFVRGGRRAALAFKHADVNVSAVRVARGFPVCRRAYSSVNLALLSNHLYKGRVNGEQEVCRAAQIVKVKPGAGANTSFDKGA